ncbi:MAG: hypothetical protein Fur0010_06580 [Bdellovibrio sp.]
MNNPLEQLHILDLTNRLPGPLAVSHLATLGARVYKPRKVIDSDPFKNSKVEIFEHWHKQFTNKVEILDQEIKTIVEDKNISIILYTKSFKSEVEQLKKIKGHLYFLEIKASDNPLLTALHDLNALANTNLLMIHLNSLRESGARMNSPLPAPMIPLAGVQFASKISMMLLAGYLKCQQTKQHIWHSCSLDQTIKEFAELIFPKNRIGPFLPNGANPCYLIYPLQEENYFLVVAAIEEKYWKIFLEHINIKDEILDRFDESGKVIEKISKVLKTMSYQKFQNDVLLGKCLSLISLPKM